MKNELLARLRDSRGESLVESLLAMLVIVLAGLMLAGAVVSSARVNRGVKDVVTFPAYKDPAGSGTAHLKRQQGGFLDPDDPQNDETAVTVYFDGGEIVYYEQG